MTGGGPAPRSLEEKRALLKKLLEGEAQKARPAVIPVRADGLIPTSYSQERLWFLDNLAPDSGLYCLITGVRMSGRVDRDAMSWAMDQVAERHATLRTIYTLKDGQVFQQVLPNARGGMAFKDMTHLPVDERDAAVKAYAQADSMKGFSLASGPVYRAHLLKLDEERHVFLLNMHHIAVDGWSVYLIVQDMATFYGARLRQETPVLPRLALEYTEYSRRQRAHFEGPAKERELAFWRRELEGAPRTLALPTDYPQAARHTVDDGDWVSFVLPAKQVAALKELAQGERATLFMVLLAAFQATLSLYSGQDDVVVGVGAANRDRSDTEGLVGCFVNTLALRADLSGRPSFRELLRRVRQRALDAFSHQGTPFERVVQDLNPDRSLAQTPLFQVMFGMNNPPRVALSAEGLTLAEYLTRRSITHLDLALECQEGGMGPDHAAAPDEVIGNFDYRTTLFEHATIERMCEHFKRILDAAIRTPDVPLSQLELLSTTERETVLAHWGRGEPLPSSSLSLHGLFERAVSRTPQAVAVEGDDGSLTYQELDQRAEKLAAWLRAQGLGPEDRVGVLLEPGSVRLPVALLGVLKAGAAYVPLDPRWPGNRLGFVCDDSRLQWALTDARHQALLAGRVPHTLRLDADWERVAHAPGLPAVSVHPSSLAYVIYTSGSTGRPKGTLVEHRNVVAFVEGACRRYGLTAQDRVSQLASVAFDLSVLEIFTPLSVGGTLVLASTVASESLPALLALLDRQRVTVVPISTAVFHLLVGQLESGGARMPPSVRLLICGGERAQETKFQTFLALGTGVQLVNAYGPTETTVEVTTWTDVLGKPGRPARPVPIGSPYPGAQAYVLGPDGVPVPPGVPGELYLGGDGVSRGYGGRPALTAERFVPDPFSGRPGARLYRSGDLARWRDDGALEFLGRGDGQVKVRGMRLELGELEAALVQHPEVDNAAVTALTEGGDTTLVAYVVPRAGHAPTDESLREHLLRWIPAALVPAHYVALDALPLTPNGKVDHRALPAPARRLREHLAPRTPMEQRLAELWRSVLKLDAVGIADDFFRLGGHSLMLVDMLSRVEAQFGRRILLAELVEGCTIARVASLLEAAPAPAKAKAALLVPLETQGSGAPLFLIHPIGGNVACYVELVRRLGASRPVYGLVAPGVQDDEAPQTDLGALAARYADEISALRPRGPYLLGGWSMGGILAFEVARVLAERGQGKAELLIIDSALAFGDGGASPAVRAQSFLRDVGVEVDEAELVADTEDAELERVTAALAAHGRALPAAEVGRLYRVYLAHRQALARYRPTPQQVSGTVVLGRAQRAEGVNTLLTEGWRSLLEGGARVQVVEGEHFSLLRQDVDGVVKAALATFPAETSSAASYASLPSVPRSGKWPVRRAGAADRFRLYCFPCAGGSSSTYSPWVGRAPASVEVIPLEPPGRGRRMREQNLTDYDGYLGSVLADLEPLLGEAPFGFFGHSMGALVAFDLAQALRERGAPLPQILFAAACQPPHVPFPPRAWRDLDDAGLTREIVNLGGMSEEVAASRELLELMLPGLRADITLYEKYQYRPAAPLPLPIVAYAGRSDKMSEPELERWREQSSVGFDHQLFAGGHFFVNDPAVPAAVFARLDALFRARGR